MKCHRDCISARWLIHRFPSSFLVVGLLAAHLLVPNRVDAATYYLAVNGDDSSSGSSDAPWAKFAHAFSSMKGGDTLIVKNGTYKQNIAQVPNGTANAYTTIKAENSGRVLIDGSSVLEQWDASLSLNENSYVAVEGIKFKTSPDSNYIFPANIISSHHVKIFRCAFYDAPDHANTATINIGPDSHHILMEECWAWGTSRYKFLVYQSQNVILRRCVARHDYYNIKGTEADNQTATFTMYDSTNFLLQNCISIDSGNADQSLTGIFFGGIWLENNDQRDTSGTIQGTILLNLDGMAAIQDPKIIGTRLIENTVAWNSRGGYNANTLVSSSTRTTALNHCTLGNIFGSYDDGSYPAWGTGAQATASMKDLATTRNSIITGAKSYGIADYMTSDYDVLYQNAADYGGAASGAGSSKGAHDSTENPKLKYILRVEDGTPGKGTASDGGDRGATVLNRYGVSGSLWGDPGYDSLTSEPLWPFPNEAEIQQDMASYVPRAKEPSGKRGFCATGNGLYGGPITLTSYIWEYLGNPCPDGLCTGSPATGGAGGATSVGSGGSTGATSVGSGGSTGGTTSGSGGSTRPTSTGKGGAAGGTSIGRGGAGGGTSIGAGGAAGGRSIGAGGASGEATSTGRAGSGGATAMGSGGLSSGTASMGSAGSGGATAIGSGGSGDATSIGRGGPGDAAATGTDGSADKATSRGGCGCNLSGRSDGDFGWILALTMTVCLCYGLRLRRSP